MKLRDYQFQLILEARRAAAEGNSRVLLYLPTGGGKTVIAAGLIKQYHALGRSALFIVRQEPLIGQTIAKLEAVGCPCGVIKAGYTPDLTQQVQVATIQTMNRRGLYPDADLVILDEAHGATAAQYDQVFTQYQQSLILGLTATPFRTKRSESLKSRFDTLVGTLQSADLVERGFLVPPVVYGWDKDALDLSQARTTQGDFNLADLAVACDRPEMIAAAVEEYQDRCPGRRAIAFTVSLEHSAHVAKAFNQAGIPAETVDSSTPPEERQAIYQRLRNCETLVVVSVGVLSEGFDEPSAEVGLMLRPTKSRGLWLQQVGRVLRPSPATGKAEAIILDQAGNTWRHGLPTDKISLSLTEAPLDNGPGEAPVKLCPDCGTMVSASLMLCPTCAHIFPPPAKASLTAKLTKLEAQDLLERRLDYWWQVAETNFYSRGWIFHQFLAAYPTPTYEQLKSLGKKLGYKRGWAKHKYLEFYPEEAQEPSLVQVNY